MIITVSSMGSAFLLIVVGCFARLWRLDSFLTGTYLSDENYSTIVQVYNRFYLDRHSKSAGMAWITSPAWFDFIYSRFGLSPMAGRLSAIFLSTLGLIGLFLFVRRRWLFASALWSAALAGSFLHHLYFSRLALEHALVFGILPWLLFCFDLHLERPTPLRSLALAVLSVLGVFCYPGFSVLLGALGLSLALVYRNSSRKFFRTVAVGVGGLVLWLGFCFVAYGPNSWRYYNFNAVALSAGVYFSNLLILCREVFFRANSWTVPFDRPFFGWHGPVLMALGVWAALRSRDRLILALAVTVAIDIALAAFGADDPGIRRAEATLVLLPIVAAYGLTTWRASFKKEICI